MQSKIQGFLKNGCIYAVKYFDFFKFISTAHMQPIFYHFIKYWLHNILWVFLPRHVLPSLVHETIYALICINIIYIVVLL
jgi:hypothetical protein